MYVSVPRGLVFFDHSDHGLGSPSLVRYDPQTGQVHAVAGSQADDVVCDVARDGDRLALRSADWLTVRGTNRSRLTFLAQGVPLGATDRFLSHWSVFDASGAFALVGTLNGKSRPVVLDTATGALVDTLDRAVDAWRGELDPRDGRLWAPDPRTPGTLLKIDGATGAHDALKLAGGAKSAIARLRFTRDGASLLVVGEKGLLARHGRDGTLSWSLNVAGIGRVGAGNLFLNESGSHLLLSLPESKNSAWGEDLVVDVAQGTVTARIVRQRAPPARLAADWFGDTLLTYAGEIVDFFSGAVVGTLALEGRA